MSCASFTTSALHVVNSVPEGFMGGGGRTKSTQQTMRDRRNNPINLRSILSNLCFPKVPVPSDDQIRRPNSDGQILTTKFDLQIQFEIGHAIPRMKRLNNQTNMPHSNAIVSQ